MTDELREGERYVVYDDTQGCLVVFLGFDSEGSALILWDEAPFLGAVGVRASRLQPMPTRFDRVVP